MRAVLSGMTAALVTFMLLLTPMAQADNAEVTVQSAVEKTEVYVGEPFLFQVQVQGSDESSEPALPDMPAFDVEALGGQQNNSQSITIINGRVQQVVQRGYIYSYRLTARTPGTHEIPAIPVTLGGAQYTTNPISVRVTTPKEDQDFRLQLSLSSEQAYVGQPVKIEVKWLVGRDARNVRFTMPIFDDKRLAVADPEPPKGPPADELPVPVGNSQVFARKVQTQQDGRSWLSVEFDRIITPREPGAYTWPAATVAFDTVTGRARNRSPFDNFFDDSFFAMRRDDYRTVVIPSNEVQLEVLPLPQEGRPASFTGLVGTFQIETSASPTEANVGDPITLTIRVSGCPSMDHVELPPLDQQPDLAKLFRIPKEMAPGRVEPAARPDGMPVKVFTQTLRAMESSTRAIPPIELPCFDPESKAYRIARSAPIPITIHETHVVTATDAEGADPVPQVKNTLTLWREGIAHNYEDDTVLRDEEALFPGPASPLFWLFAAGPVAFAITALARLWNIWRNADPARRQARRAYATFRVALKQAKEAPRDQGHDLLLEALRAYLGARLQLPPGALTFRDVQQPLTDRGVMPGTLELLEDVMEACEAARYAGGSPSGGDMPALVERAAKLVQALESEIKP